MIISKSSWHYKFLEATLVEVPDTLFVYIASLIYVQLLIIFAGIFIGAVGYIVGFAVINIFTIQLPSFAIVIVGWTLSALVYLLYKYIKPKLTKSVVQLHFRE